MTSDNSRVGIWNRERRDGSRGHSNASDSIVEMMRATLH